MAEITNLQKARLAKLQAQTSGMDRIDQFLSTPVKNTEQPLSGGSGRIKKRVFNADAQTTGVASAGAPKAKQTQKAEKQAQKQVETQEISKSEKSKDKDNDNG